MTAPRDNITRMPRSVEAQGGSDSPARPATFDAARADRIVQTALGRIDLDAIERRLRDDRPDLIEQLRHRRPSTLDRIGDALGSDRMIPVYLGFVSGSLFSMAMAIIWARTL